MTTQEQMLGRLVLRKAPPSVIHLFVAHDTAQAAWRAARLHDLIWLASRGPLNAAETARLHAALLAAVRAVPAIDDDPWCATTLTHVAAHLATPTRETRRALVDRSAGWWEVTTWPGKTRPVALRRDACAALCAAVADGAYGAIEWAIESPYGSLVPGHGPAVRDAFRREMPEPPRWLAGDSTPRRAVAPCAA